MPELKSGQSFASRFTLIRRLGTGGMGEAWLARDEDLGTEVVAKFLPGDPTVDQVFLLRQECRNARRLAHPNIVRMFDFHQEGSRRFITMDYIDGDDIGALRGESPQKILRTVLPLVEALEYAHGEGVVHRDLKTSNVLLDASGRPFLVDFGVAALLEPATSDLHLSGGGSRLNASPQQLNGESPDPADDVFSLGVLLYELLTGAPPFLAESRDDLNSSATPAPLVSRHPLPQGLQVLVDSMLAKSRHERPAGMVPIKQALEQILEQSPESATVPPRVGRQEIRLSPPPKVPAVRAATSESSAMRPLESIEDRDRRSFPWLATSVFLLVGALTVAVFVLLPGWVEDRRSSPGAGEGSQIADPEEEIPESTEPVASAASERTEVPSIAETASEDSEPQPVKRAKPAQVGIPPPQPNPVKDPYAEAMSVGLSAVERSDYPEAREAFSRAVSLRPGSAEATDALAHAEEELRLAQISELRELARASEQEERWHDAVKEYSAALAIDSTLRFAIEGQRQGHRRADLDDRLAFHIGHPERLTSDQVLDEAKELVAEARAIESGGPKLRQQIERLGQQIQIASSPIQVTLISDNLTEVVVYRIGRLGRFERHELNLRPGTYTVVGSREGYRDVRRQLEVIPGRTLEPLTVRCEEKI
jgi:serine/threonine protein kinase